MYIIHTMGNILEVMGQDQRSLHATHPHMLVIICATLGNKPFRNVNVIERTRQDVPFFSRFIARLWLHDLKYIGLGRGSLCVTHPLMPMICFA